MMRIDMEIINQKKNALMNREEAWVMIDHGGKPTPPRKEIIADVAKQFKAKEDCVIVDKIFSETGKPASRVKVLVYPKADAVPKAKLDKMQIRMGLKKAEKKGEAVKPAGGEAAKPAEGTQNAAPAAADKPAEAKVEKPTDAKPEEKKEEAKADGKPAAEGAAAEEKKPEEKKE
jgi:ribosomal protein S24E